MVEERRQSSDQPAPDDKDEARQAEERLESLLATNRHLKRKIFDLYTVFEISRNFNAVLDYHSLLDSFIFTCLGQVGGLKGTIFLQPDGKPGQFYPTMSKGSGQNPTEDQFFSAESDLARYLSKLNRPALTRDLLGDISTEDEKRILELFASGIVVPLIYQTKLRGIFCISEKLNEREFGPDDIEFLSILGNQIAVAIENARLYESERTATNQLRAAQEQLLRKERLAALGEMSAKVAHEVNNPLGIIKNYLSLILRSTEIDDTAREHVDVVKQEINRIAEIVRHLLEFYRPQPVRYTPVDIVETIDDVLTLTERQLESAGITVERDSNSDSNPVSGSVDQLKQVFLNLVINARDAMADGGRLTVGINRLEGEVKITFCDTGAGIAPEIVDRIFEPFFTTKEPGKGTGLGLSVCYGIINRHNGSITYKNLAVGGCFEIRLPLIGE